MRELVLVGLLAAAVQEERPFFDLQVCSQILIAAAVVAVAVVVRERRAVNLVAVVAQELYRRVTETC